MSLGAQSWTVHAAEQLKSSIVYYTLGGIVNAAQHAFASPFPHVCMSHTQHGAVPHLNECLVAQINVLHVATAPALVAVGVGMDAGAAATAAQQQRQWERTTSGCMSAAV